MAMQKAKQLKKLVENLQKELGRQLTLEDLNDLLNGRAPKSLKIGGTN
jgi:hypothetical protein